MAEQLDKLLTQAQVVELTGMSSGWFEMNRFKGTGIPYVKMGRAVRYKASDVQRWINDHYVSTRIKQAAMAS